MRTPDQIEDSDMPVGYIYSLVVHTAADISGTFMEFKKKGTILKTGNDLVKVWDVRSPRGSSTHFIHMQYLGFATEASDELKAYRWVDFNFVGFTPYRHSEPALIEPVKLR